MSHQLYPEPDPSAWDITFLCFLSGCREIGFPQNKRQAADQLRQCRNSLSHEVKSAVDQREFENLWNRVANCLVNMVDVGNREHMKEEIEKLKNIQATSESKAVCGCNDKCCDNAVDSEKNGQNNNHEMENWTYLRLPCWRCGGDRKFSFRDGVPWMARASSNVF